MIIYCTKCWKDNPANNKACFHCGARLEVEENTYTSKLIHALSHPESLTVQRAAWILGEIKALEAVEPLIKLSQLSKEMGILESVAEAIGKIGNERAVDILSHLMTSSYITVRLKAIEALGRIGSTNARAALSKALHDPNSSVSVAARQALEVLDSSKK